MEVHLTATPWSLKATTAKYASQDKKYHEIRGHGSCWGIRE